MKWLKIAIGSIIVIIIILIIMLLVLLNSNNSSIIEQEGGSNLEVLPIENANITRVSNRDEYYTIKYILDTYFRYINYMDTTAIELNITNLPNQQEIIQNYTNTAINGLKGILDEEYSKNEEQLKKDLMEYKNKNFRLDRVYSQEKTLRKTVYFAYITLDFNKEMQIIIKMDAISNCFSILPNSYIIENKYSEKDLDKIEVKNIVLNDYNKYEYLSVTDKMMAQSYLEDYANTILNNSKKSYEILDSEYKKQRFPTLEEYNNYIATSKKDYEMLRAIQYNITSNEDGMIYTCRDQYGNVYIFRETAIMEYTVELDDYTLENVAFTEKYNEVNNRDKGILNVDKFFKMLNMQDYKSAYSLLDNNFKQTYFKTQTDFENYMKNEVFRYNKVEYEEYSNQITDIHTYKVMLSDATEQSEEKVEFNIVMKLLEGTNFVMSFEVN